MAVFLRQLINNLPRVPVQKGTRAESPWAICAALSVGQYCYFIVGFLAWIIDAFDFFAVSVTLIRLGKQFHPHSVSEVSTAVTLTLLFRSVGALAFGIITDRYGRRWPLTINLICIGALSLGTGFVRTFPHFLAIRCLFGVFMGGLWGMATATSLENLPPQARGLFSGILQEGYAIGYLLAATVNLSLVAQTNDWRMIFYLAGGLSFFVAGLRAACPESYVFLEAQEDARRHPDILGRSPTTIYCQALQTAIKLHWGRFLLTVLLMAGFNFLAHGSQDLYPTFLQVTKELSSHDASILTIIGTCGALVGGVTAGWLSQILGRRLTIIVMVLWAAAFIPLWIFPNSVWGLAIGAFLIQFGVQGAWGVIPIYLSEISPSAFRGIFTGLSYQLGNMISSASSQIEARGGEAHQIKVKGQDVNDYAFVQGALIGSVSVCLIILICLGKEHHGKTFNRIAIQAPTMDMPSEEPDYIASDFPIERKEIEDWTFKTG